MSTIKGQRKTLLTLTQSTVSPVIRPVGSGGIAGMIAGAGASDGLSSSFAGAATELYLNKIKKMKHCFIRSNSLVKLTDGQKVFDQQKTQKNPEKYTILC